MSDYKIRDYLIKHIKGGEAFYPIDQFIEEIPFDATGEIPEGLPYSLWQQLYHLRMAQLDILKFSMNDDYKELNWPDDYWPKSPAPTAEDEWLKMVDSFFKERDQFVGLIRDENNDLYRPFEHGTGQNLLREALLLIEHNAYHSGQMLIIMRLLELHD